jgi:hypothetical protein
LETDYFSHSAYRKGKNDIPYIRNKFVCYDFKERRIVPRHYAIRTNWEGHHLKSRLVETSADGETWREVEHEELNGKWVTGTFAVAGGGQRRFIRLVNIGRNHILTDCLAISGWEICGRLVE